MSNAHLQNALKELSVLGAQHVPPVSELEAAENGTTWSGPLENGSWELIKHREDSWTTHTTHGA